MDNADTPKARRPLPTPGAVPATQRPSTPILGPTPISPASFYGSVKPPPLPSRPKNPGSNHTAYVAPPPRYESPAPDKSPGYREPELIEEEVMDDDDALPDLIPQANDNTWGEITMDPGNGWSTVDPWQETTTTSRWGDEGTTLWPAKTGTVTATTNFDTMAYTDSSNIDQSHPIDGRSSYEETQWWNPIERTRNARPGSGVLAPILAEELHDPNHSLFSVNIVSTPHYAPVASSNDNSATSSSSSIEAAPPPTDQETRMSIPHPNAYYCPKDNGWVILSWKASSVSPPLAQSYIDSPGVLLPDLTRRKRSQSCLDDGGHGKSNKTHHFHKHNKAVDSHKLTPPFRRDDWREETLKQRRRAGTIMPADVDIRSVSAREGDSLHENGPETVDDEGKLLDLYVCCQCCFYCVASGIIEGVVPRKFLDELVRDKRAHPMLGKTAEQSISLAFETLLT